MWNRKGAHGRRWRGFADFLKEGENQRGRRGQKIRRGEEDSSRLSMKQILRRWATKAPPWICYFQSLALYKIKALKDLTPMSHGKLLRPSPSESWMNSWCMRVIFFGLFCFVLPGNPYHCVHVLFTYNTTAWHSPNEHLRWRMKGYGSWSSPWLTHIRSWN